MNLFSPNTGYLGIDVGSFGIKLVELKKRGGFLSLHTYAYTENNAGASVLDWQNDLKYTAEVIKNLHEQSGAQSQSVVAALPTFSVFSSAITLSNVDKETLPAAINWEAKKIIPLPIEDMILDWKEIPDPQAPKNSRKILLTGAPKELVKKYVEVFKLAGLTLLSLETETFSLVRSLLGNDPSAVMIVEIGASTTDISVVSHSIPLLVRSLDSGGSAITKAVSKNLNIGLERAEQFKYDLGVSLPGENDTDIPKSILDALTPIINEIKYMISLYEGKHEDKVEKVILSGGSAMLPNFDKYLAKILNLNVVVGDPWARISYPVDLRPVLQEIGPRFAVAVGLAMRG